MIQEKDKLHLQAGRYEALGDAIFAVAMTLLVLELHIPHPEGNTWYDFAVSFHEVWTSFLCYFISFVVLGIMWFGHRMVFEYIGRLNKYFIFLGIPFYMMVCIVPFSTRFLAANTLRWFGIAIYGLNLSLCNLALYAQWTYGIKRPSLMIKELPDDVKKEARLSFLISPVLYALAIIIGFFYPVISIIIYVVTPLLYLLPSKLDKYLP
jgi:uncharacterized membrane protein